MRWLLALVLAGVALADGEAERLYKEGKYAEARPLFERRLADDTPLEESVYLRRHIGSCIWQGGGAVGPVIAMFERALADWKKARGDEDHADIAGILNELAICYARNRQPGPALATSERELAMRERLFGREHLLTAESIGNRASFLFELGRFEECVRLRREELRIRDTLLAESDPGRMYPRWQLADTLEKLPGNEDEVLRVAHDLLALAKRHGDDLAAARAHSSIGRVQLDLARFEESQRSAEAALALFRRTRGAATEEVAQTLHSLSAALSSQGRTEEALRPAEQALRLMRETFGATHPACGPSLLVLARALMEQRRFSDAVVPLRQAERIFRPLDEAANLAHILEALAGCLRRTGARREALRAIDEALELFRRVGTRDASAVAGAIQVRALLLGDAGRYRESLDGHRRALAMVRRIYPGDHPNVARMLGTLAIAQHGLELYDDAAETQARGVEMWNRLFSGDHPDKPEALARLGRSLTWANRPWEAEVHFRAALRMAPRVWSAPPEGIWALYAECLRHLGRPGEALVWARRIKHPTPWLRHQIALSLVETRRLDEALAALDAILESGGAPTTRSHRALVLSDLGRTEEALAAARDAHARAEETESLFARCECARVLGMCLYRAGQRDEAQRVREAALELDRQRGLVDPESLRHVAQGRMARGDHAGAIPLLEEAIAEMERRRLGARAFANADLRAYLRLQAPLATERMVRAQLAEGRAGEAVRFLERGRARDALDLLARSRFDPLAEAERRAREGGGDAARVGRVRETLRHTEREATLIQQSLQKTLSLDDAEPARIATLRKELAVAKRAQLAARRDRAAVIRDLVPVGAPADAGALQRMLGRRERLLLYSIGEHDGVLLVVPPTGEPIRGHVLGLGLAEATRMVDRHAAHLARGGAKARGMKTPRSGGDEGAALFDALVPAGVWKEIQEVDRVYLVPHGPLERLPFEALPTGEGPWLERGPEIAYGPSGSILRWTRERRDARRAAPRKLEMVVLGDARFEKPLAPLPGTRREAEAIAKTIRRSVTLLGEDATEERLFELAPQARMLHLATHQVVETRRLSGVCGLALSDGHLMLHEILASWRDRLSGCELVVLSACDSTRASDPNAWSEAPRAMPLGFLYAGAPAVIGSLWRVDDASTAELFSDFYKRVAKGTPKLQAFTEARRALRKKHPQPYFWAPFVYIGDPR